MERNRTEWVIHIWGKKRDNLELTDIEKFHIDMLNMYKLQQQKFDRILINIALDDVNDMELFNFLKSELSKVFIGNNVEFRYCKNDVKKCEYVTFRPYVFDRIGENVNVFYSHFKGYNSSLRILRESFPKRVIHLCEFFWIYLMYKYSLNIADVQKKLKEYSTYSWFIQKYNKDNKYSEYYKTYIDGIKSINDDFNDSINVDLGEHSPGSFVWYNLKRIGESLKDKPFVTSITDDNLGERMTHFCELYMMLFLKDNENYSVNDFNNTVNELNGPLYITIYPAKKIGREHIKEFERYLIDKKLI